MQRLTCVEFSVGNAKSSSAFAATEKKIFEELFKKIYFGILVFSVEILNPNTRGPAANLSPLFLSSIVITCSNFRIVKAFFFSNRILIYTYLFQ